MIQVIDNRTNEIINDFPALVGVWVVVELAIEKRRQCKMEEAK